jgi:hypothetical protein
MFARLSNFPKLFMAAAPAAATVNWRTMIQPLLTFSRPRELLSNFRQTRSFAKKKFMHAAARRQKRKIRRRRLQRRQYRKLIAEIRGESPPSIDSTLYDTYRSWMQDPIPLRLEKFMEPIETYVSQDLMPRFQSGLNLIKLQQALWVFKIRIPHPKYPERFANRQWRPGKRSIHEILPVVGELERKGHVYTEMSERGKMIIYPHMSIIKDFLPKAESLSDVLKEICKIVKIKDDQPEDDRTDVETTDVETTKSMKNSARGLSEFNFGEDGLSIDNQFFSIPPSSESETDFDDDFRLVEEDSDDEYSKESAYDTPTQLVFRAKEQ